MFWNCLDRLFHFMVPLAQVSGFKGSRSRGYEQLSIEPANLMQHKGKIIVIGGGASGMMAAGKAAEAGAHVILLEKTRQLGQKMLISGKTRCNLTNAKDTDAFIPMYGRNGRFLYRAFHKFFREDLITLLKRYGVETKIERGEGYSRHPTRLETWSMRSENT